MADQMADQMADHMQIVIKQQEEAHELHVAYDFQRRLEMFCSNDQDGNLPEYCSKLQTIREEMDLKCEWMWKRFNDELNFRDICGTFLPND